MAPVTCAVITAGVGLGSVLGTTMLPSGKANWRPGDTSIEARETVNFDVSPVTTPVPTTPFSGGTPAMKERVASDTA